jgi:hypothetical protein
MYVSTLISLPSRSTDYCLQILAESTFWRELHFTSATRLVACTQALGLAKNRGNPALCWIRAISLQIRSPEVPVWVASACELLAHTTQLRNLNIAPCTLSLVSSATLSARTSLRTLDLHLSPVDPPFSHFRIASFPALECLSICMLHPDWAQEDGALFATCTLPHLHTLHWQGHPSAGFLSFLADARFDALQNVQLRAVSQLSETSVAGLTAFLAAHALQRLTLALIYADELERVLPSARTIALMPLYGVPGAIPPPTLVACLPPNICALELHGVARDEGLCPLLRALVDTAPRTLTDVILLTSSPGRFFTWTSPSVTEAVSGEEFALMGRLLMCAIALSSRGVDVCDRSGCTIRDCFSTYTTCA